MVRAGRTNRVHDHHGRGSSDAQLLRVIPGIAMLARPNIKVVVTGDLEWGKNLPTVGSWAPAGGFVAPTTDAKFEAEQIGVVAAVAF